MTPLLRFIFNLLIVVALLGCWGFVGLYTATYRWWHNDIGRHLVAFSSCLGLFMLYFTYRIFVPTVPGQFVILLVLFVLLDVVILWRLVLFIRIRLEQRRRRRARAGYAESEGEVSSGTDAGS